MRVFFLLVVTVLVTLGCASPSSPAVNLSSEAMSSRYLSSSYQALDSIMFPIVSKDVDLNQHNFNVQQLYGGSSSTVISPSADGTAVVLKAQPSGDRFVSLQLKIRDSAKLDFNVDVSSQVGADYLRFYINGELRGTYDSTNNGHKYFYLQKSDNVPENDSSAQVTWVYTKDAYVSLGRDDAQISAIKFTDVIKITQLYNVAESTHTLVVGDPSIFMATSPGWNLNGLKGYLPRNVAGTPDRVPFHYWYANYGDYVFTRQTPAAYNPGYPWVYKGALTYVLSQETYAGDYDRIPLYEYYLQTGSDHCFDTIDPVTFAPWGFSNFGIAAFIYRP